MVVEWEVGAATSVVVPDALGWLLARRGLDRLPGATDVRITSHVADPRQRWDQPTRAGVAQAARSGAPAVVEGRAVVERLAERRWLAWFPRPVGPHHAVNVGGASVGLIAERPGLSLVRSHLTAVSWKAEVLQAAANLAGTTVGDRLLDGWVDRGAGIIDDEVRWACVVEVADPSRRPVRAWSNGWAPRATAAALAARLPVSRSARSVRDADPRDLLDAMARDTGLRWSVTTPDGP